MAIQNELNNSESTESVETYEFEPIQGYPMLNWKGKLPFRSTQYYPAQLKETYGDEVEGWQNKIYWGDNLQVMSHLLKTHRGKITLIYIDPPFDSKAQYKKTIERRGKTVKNDQNVFEEKQYTDIWTNDEYLQFMYERLMLMRELLADNGSIYVHCDWHKSHYLRCILDEIFGGHNFRNDITWVRSTNPKGSQYESSRYDVFTDTLLFYAKNESTKPDLDTIRIPLTKEELIEKYHREDEKGRFYNGPIVRSSSMGTRPNLVYEYKGYSPPVFGWRVNKQQLEEIDRQGNLGWSKGGNPFRKLRLEDDRGKPIGNFWDDISLIGSQAGERVGYPTQKPEKLVERIIRASSNPGDLVFDCFMGSGTTQAVAMKLGRRFIGADINLGAVETTTKRLLKIPEEIQVNTAQGKFDIQNEDTEDIQTYYTGFEIYNVNHYDVFRNPVEAKGLLIEALEIQPMLTGGIYDGERDRRMVKIMPINRIATREDLNELITGFDYKAFEKQKEEHPTRPVEKLLLVCMGHEPDLAAALQNEVPYPLDVEVMDILRDKSKLEFKRESKAKIVRSNGHLIIEQFYPMNLLQKLSIIEENVENWRELVESVKVDFNYDGAVLNPLIVDSPAEDELVKGTYPIPEDAGTIRVKITDLLSESLEETVE